MQKTNSFQFPWPHILESYPIIRPAFISVTWERASPEARVSFEGSARDWLSGSPPPFLGLAHVGVVLLIDKRHWHMGCLLWSSGWRWAELHCSGAKCYVCGRGGGGWCLWLSFVCVRLSGNGWIFWLVCLLGTMFLLSLKTGRAWASAHLFSSGFPSVLS